MSIWTTFLTNLFPPRFKTTSGSNLATVLAAIGNTFDSLDPAQTKLANQFSVSGASGSYLDLNGEDWGVPRRAGETDAAYQARILSTLPGYIQGPTIAALKGAVKPFTGVEPLVYTATQYSQLFPLTFPLQFGGNTTQDYFTVHVYMQNPNAVKYRQADVVNAVDSVKRVIATVIIHWDHVWTSANAVSMATMAGYQMVQQSATTTVQ